MRGRPLQCWPPQAFSTPVGVLGLLGLLLRCCWPPRQPSCLLFANLLLPSLPSVGDVYLIFQRGMGVAGAAAATAAAQVSRPARLRAGKASMVSSRGFLADLDPTLDWIAVPRGRRVSGLSLARRPPPGRPPPALDGAPLAFSVLLPGLHPCNRPRNSPTTHQPPTSTHATPPLLLCRACPAPAKCASF